MRHDEERLLKRGNGPFLYAVLWTAGAFPRGQVTYVLADHAHDAIEQVRHYVHPVDWSPYGGNSFCPVTVECIDGMFDFVPVEGVVRGQWKESRPDPLRSAADEPIALEPKTPARQRKGK